MVLLELLVQVLDKKLAGLLQSLPTFGRFNDEGFISSHGCIVLSKVQGLLFTIFQTQIHPSALLHNFPYATVVGVSWDHPSWDQGFVYKNGVLTLTGWELRWPYYSKVGHVDEPWLSDVNNYDVAVGGGIASNKWTALIWTETEGLLPLNALIPPDSGWRLASASAINDYGQITGEGVLNDDPAAATYRLDPIPPTLKIRRQAGRVEVSWTPRWPGLVLEATDSLATPNWQPVPTGTTNVVWFSTTNWARFFRLNLEGIRGLCCPPQALPQAQ
jgi:hypothetical protein